MAMIFNNGVEISKMAENIDPMVTALNIVKVLPL